MLPDLYAKPGLSLFLVLMGGCACLPQTESVPPGSVKNAPYVESYEEQPVSAVVAPDDYRDPIEGFNRVVFKFNDVSYRYVLTPAAKAYQKVMPGPVKTGVNNVFLNIQEPMYSFNFLLQGKVCKCAKSLARFTLNSTVGLLGIYDPANAWWDMEREPMHLDDTLAYYDVGYGAYLVLPLFGPSDLRGTSSLALDYYAHPLNLVEHKRTRLELKAFDGFRDNASRLANYPESIEGVDDTYLFIRNLHLQGLQRDSRELRESAPNSDPEQNSDSAGKVDE